MLVVLRLALVGVVTILGGGHFNRDYGEFSSGVDTVEFQPPCADAFSAHPNELIDDLVLHRR